MENNHQAENNNELSVKDELTQTRDELATAKNELRILRIKEVVKKLGISVSTIYSWLKPTSDQFDETFPRPIKLSQKTVGWLSTEIDQWLLKKAETSRL